MRGCGGGGRRSSVEILAREGREGSGAALEGELRLEEARSPRGGGRPTGRTGRRRRSEASRRRGLRRRSATGLHSTGRPNDGATADTSSRRFDRASRAASRRPCPLESRRDGLSFRPARPIPRPSRAGSPPRTPRRGGVLGGRGRGRRRASLPGGCAADRSGDVTRGPSPSLIFGEARVFRRLPDAAPAGGTGSCARRAR